MFMFRSKRNNLTKRLLKARIRRERENHETGSEVEGGEPAAASGGGGGTGGGCGESLVRTSLLKKLKENQLELLDKAVKSGGADLSHCVLLPRECGGEQAHVLCCQMWRWPELQQADELKRLPVCASANDPVYICCNPYHLSKLSSSTVDRPVQTMDDGCMDINDMSQCNWSSVSMESRPPPYERYESERLKPEDRAPSEIPLLCGDRYPGSLTTSGEGLNSGSREWCRLAYWEMARRVGRQFPVEVPSVNVFSDVSHGDGLCLATLAQHSFSPPEAVMRTRAKIGHGVILSREVDGIWAYNLSDHPIFVNSPTLDSMEPNSLVVYRVSPGHCLCIFNTARAINGNHRWCNNNEQPTGPIDPNSVRISFAKGWGQGYSRQEITACPCWLEVLLAPCR